MRESNERDYQWLCLAISGVMVQLIGVAALSLGLKRRYH